MTKKIASKKSVKKEKKKDVVSETAIFAAGCFWSVEELYRILPGVISTEVGYTGGHWKDPGYSMVCTGITGHAEAVRIVYDPKKITYEKLLDIFWENHNPTTPNRQGWDIGTQYRSAIFYTTDKQNEIAQKSLDALSKSGKFKNPIVTKIEKAVEFYPAEEYHQKYLLKKGLKSCHI
ncbi:MAG TPA: peptide-methionine (S)-S-oxide reductase MsrA [Alphaproteobacteria bacterium]|nr:peptide-methionine (S)-S-oxide reductase MsrA [Alphaproteobacteria bacterium]